MMLINKNNGIDVFICFLKHRNHKYPAIVCANNQARMVFRSINNRLSYFFIRKEELKLMLIVEVLDDQWIEIDWTVVDLLWKNFDRTYEQWYAMLT